MSNRKQQLKHSFHFLGILSFLILMIVLNSFPAHSQTLSNEKLTEAQNKYELGFFHQTISLLDSCLEANVFTDKTTKAEAYALLARAYIAEDYHNKAEGAINKLLELNVNYQPTATKDQKFMTLTSKIQQQKRTANRRSYIKKRKWWIIGGASAAVVAGVAYILLQPEPDKPLPGPPDFPYH